MFAYILLFHTKIGLQVESLRNDAREAQDVSRFYQPLVQVFEYDKQMLMLYRVMYMQRDKLDYKYNDVNNHSVNSLIYSHLFPN